FVVGCDVGSQGTNGALYDADGTLAGSAYEPYDLSFPHPGWAEQDPGAWSTGVERACRRLIELCPGGAAAITGLSFGSQLDGMVACDAAGRPVRPAMIWMDRRAEDQAGAVAARSSRAACSGRGVADLESSPPALNVPWRLEVD